MEVDMKKIMLAVAIIFLINYLFVTPRAFSQEINNGPMTLELPQSIHADDVSQSPIIVKLNVPNTWSMNMNQSDNRHDFIFKHLANSSTIEISLINMGTYFKNEESKTMIINSSIKGADNSFIKSAQKLNAQYDQTIGVDNILNNKITYCLFTMKTGNETAYYKFLYPTSDKNVFIIYVYFKDGAPFKDAEELINNLVMALVNSN